MKKLCLLLATVVFVYAFAMPAFAAQNDMPIHISGNTYYDPAQNLLEVSAGRASVDLAEKVQPH